MIKFIFPFTSLGAGECRYLRGPGAALSGTLGPSMKFAGRQIEGSDFTLRSTEFLRLIGATLKLYRSYRRRVPGAGRAGLGGLRAPRAARIADRGRRARALGARPRRGGHGPRAYVGINCVSLCVFMCLFLFLSFLFFSFGSLQEESRKDKKEEHSSLLAYLPASEKS